jgi:uncharacterized metal-binding protein
MRPADCAHCELDREEMACQRPGGKGHRGCPTVSPPAGAAEAARAYERPGTGKLARQASIQEGTGYERRGGALRPVKPRIEEVCEFAARMGFTRLGLAYCIGLRHEARLVADILAERGFEVVSAVCKVGAVAKEELGLSDDQKIRPGGFEPMCNPVMQAQVVNEAQTELNVVLGLCVGHDSLFLRNAEAPCTVLAVKDRVTGHNPLAAVYTSHSYWSSVKRPGRPG